MQLISTSRRKDKNHLVLYCESAISIRYLIRKINVSGVLKKRGWEFDFRGPKLFWQMGVDCIMSSQVQILTWLQLILHVPRMQKAHIVYMGPPYNSPWVCRVQLQTLLEKVADLRALQIWSNQALAFLTFTDLH